MQQLINLILKRIEIREKTKVKTKMREETYLVEDLKEPRRISEYLKRNLGFSTSLLTRVKFGGVFLNGASVHMRADVRNGDEILVKFPEERSENIPPIDIPLDVLYEDEHILAVNKPKNMPTHPSRGNSLPTLANAVMAHLGEGFVFRAINRLDRDTSGIVLIAKNGLAAANLSREMKSGGFVKKYTAIVEGTPEKNFGIIDAPIERECEDSIKRCVREDGKRAVTEYRVLKTLESGNSVCEFRLWTGRTHQIRVHSAYIGHPLVNDFLYGTRGEDTYFLHCSYLSFTHPKTKERIEIESTPSVT